MHMQGARFCEVFWGLHILLTSATAFGNDGC